MKFRSYHAVNKEDCWFVRNRVSLRPITWGQRGGTYLSYEVSFVSCCKQRRLLVCAQPGQLASDNLDMPRLRRHVTPGSIQHLISRFVDHEYRIDTPEIRANYLRRFSDVLPRNDWSALAYAVMSTHIHNVLRAGFAPCARIIQPIHTGFATWLNRRQQRLGPVFAGRYKNVGFEGELLAILLAYLHNNPVRAGVAMDPADSDWTSHRAYIGDVKAPVWLDVDLGLSLCEFSATPSGRLAFHDFVRSRSVDHGGLIVGDSEVVKSSIGLRAAVGGPAEIGSVHVLGEGLQRTPVWTCPEAQYCTPWRGNPDVVLELVASETQIDLRLIKSKARRRDIVRARRLSVLIWYRYLGRSLKQIAEPLSISLSAASQLLTNTKAIEALAPAAIRIANRCHSVKLRELVNET